MEKRDLIKRLMAAFLEELHEHVGAMNRDLLALEKNPPDSQRQSLVKNLFRSAHTIKGAAQATNVHLIERTCHRLEDVLGEIREGKREFTPDLYTVFFRAADALEDAGMRLREDQNLDHSPLAEVYSLVDQAASPPPTADAIVGRALLPVRSTETSRDGQECPSYVTAETIEPPPRDTHDATVRVLAEKLDALLAQSGELLVARRRIESRQSEMLDLRDQLSEWSAAWRAVEKSIRQWAEAAGTHGPTPACTPKTLPRRAVSLLVQVGDKLRSLEKKVDQMALAMRDDGRLLGHTCDALDDEICRVRMLPFAEACAGLDRAVRDLAQSTGKQVDLRIVGGEVEVDRAVLEELKGPLLHLVRNAVDHGLEKPADRAAVGKPGTATVTVSAELRGAMVEVVVSDDGRGFDLPRIREVAKERGWPIPQDDHDLARLVFQPGFSTARTITDVSGRGVGLDVVQSQIEALHGVVDVSFQPGQGTRFLLQVPLTLTTIRAVLTRAGTETYAVPTTNVQQIVRFDPADIVSLGGLSCLLNQGETPLPVTLLTETLGYPANRPSSGQKSLALILTAAAHRFAFVVDEVLGEQDVVVKALGARVRRLRHVSGATLLPTGRVALVLNVANLVRTAFGEPTRSLIVSTPTATAAPVRRKRLLVVDDSFTTRTLMKSILETAGYEVLTAADGGQAWELLPREPVDAVVSDVDMPRMDGFELTRAIRGSQTHPQLPVVLVTARGTAADKARGLQAGANGYVIKSSFDQGDLLAAIARLM